jgi:hypothetical protein
MAQRRRIGELVRIRFTVTITVGVIAFLISGIFAFLYYYFPNERPLLSFVAAAAAAAGGVTAAYYVGAGIRDSARTQEALREEQGAAQKALLDEQVRAERVRRVFELSARWGDPALSHARNAMSRLLEEFKKSELGAAERVKAIESAVAEEAKADEKIEGPGVRRSITMTLDFLETVALGVNTDAADEELTKRLFRGVILNYARMFGPWIKDRRDRTAQQKLYEELLDLAGRWDSS